MQGTRCDVREGADVKNLVAFAQEQLKYIDIWVLHLQATASSKCRIFSIKS